VGRFSLGRKAKILNECFQNHGGDKRQNTVSELLDVRQPRENMIDIWMTDCK
jgi:hypothetical protein